MIKILFFEPRKQRLSYGRYAKAATSLSSRFYFIRSSKNIEKTELILSAAED